MQSLNLPPYDFTFRTEKGKEFWHRTLLRLPLIGPMAIKQGVARIAMIIGTLSRSGVELTSRPAVSRALAA